MPADLATTPPIVVPDVGPGLDHRVSAALGVPVRVTGATAPLDPSALTAAEAREWQAAPPGRRRDDWLLGRAALRPLVALLGLGSDAAGLAFPHPRLSLAHAGGVAVAAGLAPTSERRPDDHHGRDGGGRHGDCTHPVLGVGVDLEPVDPAVDPRLGRVFLDADEQAWVAGRPEPEQADEVLRLWTVKEAAYKATPANTDVTVAAFHLADPGAGVGTVAGPLPAGAVVTYVSVRLAPSGRWMRPGKAGSRGETGATGAHLAVAVCAAAGLGDRRPRGGRRGALR